MFSVFFSFSQETPNATRLRLSMLLVRLVNGVSDAYQKGTHASSVSELAVGQVGSRARGLRSRVCLLCWPSGDSRSRNAFAGGPASLGSGHATRGVTQRDALSLRSAPRHRCASLLLVDSARLFKVSSTTFCSIIVD